MKIWEDYVTGKQTYEQLSIAYKISKRTVQRYIERISVTPSNPLPRVIVVLMDTTYFGRKFGVMLFKDAYTGENLLRYYVKTKQMQNTKKGWIH